MNSHAERVQRLQLNLIILTLLMVAAGAIAVTKAVAPIDPSGQYGCTGTGPNGKSYDADLAVEKNNDGYNLTWSNEGETAGIGVGILKGDVLTAIFQTPNAVGVVAFTVSKNGLDGTWTIPQLDGAISPEVCTVGSGPAKAA